MFETPQKEHDWLHRLVGDWTFEGECSGGPDQPPMKNSGTLRISSVGGLWTVAEGSTPMPEGGPMTSVITLGFDAAKGKFVGSFVASTMTRMWIYEGSLDAAGKVLTLDAEGPSFCGDGTMASYQDIITIVDDDHHIFTGQVRGPDGKWTVFMTAHYHRVGAARAAQPMTAAAG